MSESINPSSISGKPEVGEQREITSRNDVVEVFVRRFGDAEPLQSFARQRPFVGGRDVGQQQPDALAAQPHRDEEVIGDVDEADGHLAGLLAQDRDQRFEAGRRSLGEQSQLPATFFAVTHDGEVAAGVVFRTRADLACPWPAIARHDCIVARGRQTSQWETPENPALAPPQPGCTVRAMRTLVADHPLIAHKLTALRDQRTDSPTFRRLVDELVTLLAYEATRDVRTNEVDVVTPVAHARGTRLARPRPLVVPVLRAGLGMLDGMCRLLPTAEVGIPRACA